MTKPLNTIADWEGYFADLGIRKALATKYLDYAAPLLQRRLPVIFSAKHLADLLGRKESYVRSVVFGTDRHYREFTILKRTGGRRLISAPYPALLECQRWVNANVLAGTSIHESAHGYVSARHIVSNALPHAGAATLLKLDIKDFFPSISLRRVVWVFRSLGYADDVSFILGRLCTLNGTLPQGAATSPALSNIIARRMDARLKGLADKFQLSYTRYADDMTFSGDKIPLKFVSLVTLIVASEGFCINEKKTNLILGPGRRIVTGLQVNESLRPTRAFRRELRKEVYFVGKYGYRSHVAKLKKPYVSYIYSLRGKAAFWTWVDSQSEPARRSKHVLNAVSLDR